MAGPFVLDSKEEGGVPESWRLPYGLIFEVAVKIGLFLGLPDQRSNLVEDVDVQFWAGLRVLHCTHEAMISQRQLPFTTHPVLRHAYSRLRLYTNSSSISAIEIFAYLELVNPFSSTEFDVRLIQPILSSLCARHSFERN